MSDETLIACENLSFSYQQNQVRSFKEGVFKGFRKTEPNYIFKDLNFSIKKGQRLALMGENGSGKSTLCSLLAGNLSLNTGVIKTPDKLKAYLNGHVRLYDDLSVESYLFLYLQLLWPEHDKVSLSQASLEILPICGINHLKNKRVRILSSGMLAKLHLCSFTAFHSDALIIDEGLTSLDHDFHQILIKRIEKSLNCHGALIVVEHQAQLLEKYCEKTLLLKDGKVTWHV